ncbi:head-tail adaptor protein [Sinorhizobium meliloti]|uniref:head-tail adaptor protein n=1 Tax=Rhizobium meliloti TaxID=382 RepID=UPI00299EB0D0|nr:head-tail adaptor protein [Sinorhizobium meliloti]MDW9872708.1 head-tail adaptor protein [Sinorhizobium meliloti]MDW9886323.1 head-tail adaptor protein [Sinorhizobium meliloti]MDX0208205.1 head-tail adaptor protein [Sinorhizobium meliloti]
MTAAGKLDRRLRFEARQEIDNGHGSPMSGDWLLRFTVWGKRLFLRGGETVLAARLESRQPAILTIRDSKQAREITSDWRVVDTSDGRVYNIRENPKLSDDRAFLEMLVEAGVAT